MPSKKSLGKRIALSLPRQYVADLMYFATQVPSIPVQRTMQLSALVAARKQLLAPPSLVVIFAKAYALTTMEFPQLRRVYLAFPWARLFEYAVPVASIAIEKEYLGEPAVAFLRMVDPEWNRLSDSDKILRSARDMPIESFRFFKGARLLFPLPRPLRQLAWWIGLNVSARLRIKQFGTFGLSVYSGLGAESLHPKSPLTTNLNYGPIQADGHVDVRIVYDHRVLDGAVVARALARLETILNTDIVRELNAMETVAPRQVA